ncbi:MAG: hypothetical protein ACRD2Z_04025 [Thermoanaerobaculia bacterium]
MSDRRYRQRGYMDDDQRGRREKPAPGPAGKREGPRGRGLGRPTESVFRCAQCGTQVPLMGPVETDDRCPKCGADLHACTQCRHFDTSARFECRQPIAQRIAAKAKANTCELFEPRLAQGFASDSERPDDPRAAFDALFKI